MTYTYSLKSGIIRFIDSDFFQIMGSAVLFSALFTFTFCYLIPGLF